jgi:hypothetical protein
MRRVVLCAAAALALSGCSTFSWPSWSMPDWSMPDASEYTERPRSYLEICLEHDFLVKVKPWEKAVLTRNDMAWAPDPLEASRKTHTYFSKEASMPGGSAGGGGCGCN